MQSAAMLIVKKNGGVWLHNDVVLRLQVDDNPEPLKELRRLVEIHAKRFGPREVTSIAAALRPRMVADCGRTSVSPMLPSFADLNRNSRPMFALAMPVVIAEIGWMAMGLVDTLMVGPLGPEAIGAVGVGSSLFIGVVHLRDGAAARPGHAGVAGVRRRTHRRVPPLAGARHRAEPPAWRYRYR